MAQRRRWLSDDVPGCSRRSRDLPRLKSVVFTIPALLASGRRSRIVDDLDAHAGENSTLAGLPDDGPGPRWVLEAARSYLDLRLAPRPTVLSCVLRPPLTIWPLDAGLDLLERRDLEALTLALREAFCVLGARFGVASAGGVLTRLPRAHARRHRARLKEAMGEHRR